MLKDWDWTNAVRVGSGWNFEWETSRARIINFLLFALREDFTRPDFDIYRKWLCGNSESRKIIQVVGDSASPFSREGTRRAESVFEDFANARNEHIILWGFTGQRGAHGGKDANQIVNDWIDADPSKRWPRSYASFLESDSARSMHQGYTLPKNQDYRWNVIYFGDNAGFGDDMIFMDGLTDELLVLEGGVQSFAQAVNVLERGGSVYILENLRDESKRDKFSAASCLRGFVSGHANDYMSQYSSLEITSQIERLDRLEKPLKLFSLD